MNHKIISISKSIKIANELHGNKKIIVLAGGCFDILHVGHIGFLREAKKKGILFLLLESDESVNKLKGVGRPINKQRERAEVLASLTMVDLVILLTKILKSKEYDELVGKIKPDYIVATKGDLGIEHKKRQARLTGAKLIFVTDRIMNKSTTEIIKSLK